jgi:DNA ligase 1
MLAKPTRGIADILSRFEGKRLTCEYKYDGLRGQVHYFNTNIKIFSRNLEDITEAYSDLVENIRNNMAGKEKELSSFIVDCEIVAVNKTTRQLLPFQVLATRSRKATKSSDIEVHVNMFAFDILYFDECITHLPLIERR